MISVKDLLRLYAAFGEVEDKGEGTPISLGSPQMESELASYLFPLVFHILTRSIGSKIPDSGPCDERPSQFWSKLA